MRTPGGLPAGGARLLAALLAGVLWIGVLDAGLARYRYPYSGDSASYVDMAASLLADGRPRVTPWDVEPVDRDAVPQPLFPPGYPALIAALTPLAGDVRVAALWPGRIAAALLPLLIVGLFRGALPDRWLAGVAALALASQGVRDWHFLAYSDVPALALAALALGALARGLGLLGPAVRPAGWLALAGLAAGLAYTVRNAALAVLAVSAMLLVLARLRGLGPSRAALWWLLGAAAPLALLARYNLATFGVLQPYAMPASTRGWAANAGDYATAQLDDLGVPDTLLAGGPAAAVVVLVALGALLGAGLWRARATPQRQALLLLVAGYAAAGALLLVAARSRYEWGNRIDGRNVLQYTFAWALALALAVDALGSPRLRRGAAVVGIAALVSVGLATARDLVAARAYHEEAWLTLARDEAVMDAARRFPPGTLVASNAAVLFRLGVPRPVRELEVGGDDAEFGAALASLARATAGQRPSAFVLVCDEWTRRFSACGAPRRDDVAAPPCRAVRDRPPRVAV
ncbi:MAG: glycosyltransferase family 39 protein, partial [Proteobacteria bacterium]|nr:glycosyltransferase family 39 protein [Pseudomonadota bacterium]